MYNNLPLQDLLELTVRESSKDLTLKVSNNQRPRRSHRGRTYKDKRTWEIKITENPCLYRTWAENVYRSSQSHPVCQQPSRCL